MLCQWCILYGVPKMTIPSFKTEEHKEEFKDLFTDKAMEYIKLMDIVKELMYGTGTGNYSNLPGTCLEVVKDITQSLLYDTEFEFEEEHPEYRRDNMFIPRHSFKEQVTEALHDAMKTTEDE